MNSQPAWKDIMRQEGVDDMTLLTKISNDSIAGNLKERFDADVIYTNIGNVLISMNPFKWVTGLYSQEVIFEYEGRSRIEMPPHVYGVAEDAYRSMMTEKDNQCIIISGESGAGKTEAAKKVMEYIAAVSAGDESGQGLEHVKNVILQTNPLLEAFGNAKTLRNNNSSRFGKYFEIKFTQQGLPCGGNIKNYLLEKSRVVYQIPGERNYHVFYQFCKGASAEEKQSFGIRSPEDFTYLAWGSCYDVDHMDDVKEYEDMRNAMNVVGISVQEQSDIFNSVAAIMWMGNVDFQEVKTETSGVTNQDTLEYVGSLLQVPIEFLVAGLTTRTVETKRGMARGTTYNVPLNVENAYSTRDALAKAIYALMFDWLVMVVNRELAKHTKLSALLIGVLDIYGFEVFEHNVFEQLCINYVNEKLQQIFIEFTLRLEQEEYVREGIQWSPVNYFDNKVVCDLIESKNPPGIFAILDDVCRTVHADTKGADKSFTQRLSQCTKNKHFSLRGDHFVIKHYAGDVSYEAVGMIEKNKDQLSTDVIDCMQMSENKYLNGLFKELVTSKTTCGTKIKTSANDLTKTLAQCMPHYIRCLKPNDDKQANLFDHKRVMHQVQYLGLLDNVKVRRAGFAYRTTFEKFMKRYYLISGQTSYAANKIWKGDDISGCRAILGDLPIDPGQWQLGKTKTFVKDPETLFQLEDLRQNYWHNMVGRIKTAYRTYIGFKDVCANRIKKAFRTWKVFRGGCAKIVQECYRNYKGVSPFFQQRMDNERIFANKKERNRLSMISVRKFYGDYLDVKQRQELMQQMGPGASQKIVFSSKGKTVVHPGILRANKMAPRFIVLTDQALFLIALTQKKDGPPVYKLSRQIPIREITEAWLSPLVDNFVVLKVPSEFFDVVLELEFKTELISWLCLKGALQASNVFFQEQIEYFKTKKSKNKIRFMRDEMFPESMYKKDKVSIKGGLPASSSVAQFSKQGELVQLVHVVKEEERRPERKRERKRGANRYNDDVPTSLAGVAAGGTGGAGGPVAASPSPAAASPSPAGPGPARGGPGGPARGGPGGPARGGPGGPRGGPGGPARGGPGGPARGGPGGPARGGPGGPARGGPGGPARGGPQRGGPGRGGPARGGPGGPQRGGPQRGGPQRGGPQRGGPGGPGRGGGATPVAAAPAPAPAGPSYIGKCKTLYPYEAVEDDELTFQEGVMIDIISKDDMWWTGVLNGQEGVFPSNYVQEL